MVSCLLVGCLHRANFRNIQIIYNIRQAPSDCLFNKSIVAETQEEIWKRIDRCDRVAERLGNSKSWFETRPGPNLNQLVYLTVTASGLLMDILFFRLLLNFDSNETLAHAIYRSRIVTHKRLQLPRQSAIKKKVILM